MRAILKELLQLQEVDTRLNAVRARLATFPKHLAEVNARLAAGKAQLEKGKESHSTALKDRKKYELDVEQWKEKARKYRDQAYQVKTNEAFKALQHEAEMAEAEIAKSEDRLLEQMVSSEQYDRQVKAAEKSFKIVEDEARAERTKIEAEKGAAEKELAEFDAERAKAIAVIPEDLVDHYQRIAKKHGGVAVAAIRGEACGACGAHIRPHVFQELSREDNPELYHCELCTRILYYIEPPAAAEATAQAAASHTSEN
ncbi:MAG: zinc ribbon domain-containing protein [Candidatus Acidiferrales bacterium]